ncbi:MAG: hypothetical protein DWP92_02465 [Armatimonadetes bacterium]|nr:MAG: hypothetical protein DWP92_02465 [Armatimonadota bacterium]
MPDTTYTFDPDAWHPAVAGAVAGSIAAIVAALVSVPLRSPDEIIANSLSVVLVAIVLGLVSGMLWRRLRAGRSPQKVFAWAMFGGFIVAMLAVSLGQAFLLDNLIAYAAPLAAIIFVTLGFLVPLLSRVTAPLWIAAIPVLIALGLGVGLFGRGNVASGELSLDDLAPTTTVASVTTTASEQQGSPDGARDTTLTTETGVISIPEDLADSYTVSSGIATYEVPEILRGLSTVGVGRSESVGGSFSPDGSFTFTLDMLSFTSDQGRRDSKVREWFEDHPRGTFEGTTFTLPSTATVGSPITFDVTGDLTVNDITLETTWLIEARLETNGTLSIKGETDIVLSDFDVPVTTGLVTMEDSAHLEVLVSAAPTV